MLVIFDSVRNSACPAGLMSTIGLIITRSTFIDVYGNNWLVQSLETIEYRERYPEYPAAD